MKKAKTVIGLPIMFLTLVCLMAGCSSGEEKKTSIADAGRTVTADNVAGLRKIPGTNAEAVITLGYHRPGDGGGYTYYRDTVMKNAADNGGSVIVGEDGTRWRAMYSGALPLRLFGAVGDGKTDDTAAIRAWLGEIGAGGAGYAAAGRYIFTEGIRFPAKDSISVYGDGPQQTCFVYRGSDTGCDLFTVGREDRVFGGWTLERFSIDSETEMTGGAALRLVNMKHTNRLRDVSVSRVDDRNGNNIWNGVMFDRCSLTDYSGFEINAANEGIMICGSPDDDSSADIRIDGGTVTFSRIGIHCGGGFGGLYIGQVLLYGCTETGYLQDNALVSRGNREIMISGQCVLDACNSYCAYIDDPMSVQCTLSFDAFISGAGWIEPASPGTGLCIKKLPEGRVSVGSTHIKHCRSNGIELHDRTAYVTVSPLTYIVGNGGWGLYSSYGLRNITNLSVMIANAEGNHN